MYIPGQWANFLFSQAVLFMEVGSLYFAHLDKAWRFGLMQLYVSTTLIPTNRVGRSLRTQTEEHL